MPSTCKYCSNKPAAADMILCLDHLQAIIDQHRITNNNNFTIPPKTPKPILCPTPKFKDPIPTFTTKRSIKYLDNNNIAASFKSNDLVVGHYQPNIISADQQATLRKHLDAIDFTRVIYVSKYNSINRTPRLTWAYGVSPQEYPDTGIKYRGLNFIPEAMPDWLNDLALICRKIAIQQRGFDPEYNSCIIGKYDSGEDQIAFHTDAETFLSTKFCANVTIGAARDFLFKVDGQTYGIKLADSSLFLFDSLEHALPKRSGNNQVRYSISFRNMANNIGIGNSYYYCRGLAGACNDQLKTDYIDKLRTLHANGKCTKSMLTDFDKYMSTIN